MSVTVEVRTGVDAEIAEDGAEGHGWDAERQIAAGVGDAQVAEDGVDGDGEGLGCDGGAVGQAELAEDLTKADAGGV